MVRSRAAARFIAVIATAGAAAASAADSKLPDKAPADGQIPHGRVVYVDDGKCPAGEIKEITGGSKDKGIPRRVRCIKRPESNER